MTATLERLEQLVETLLQQVERELDEISPPQRERPPLRLVVNEEVRRDG
jgi:vacuolar-type H+-ATPase subunit E/Vma4